MKPIPNYPGYFATIDGSIWSFKQFTHGKKLKPYIDNHGYVQYGLMNLDGTYKPIFGHRLTASAYLNLDLTDTTTHVNHLNGIKTDNRVENLELCTPKQNMAHAASHGLMKKQVGEACNFSKLTSTDILKIRYIAKESNLTHREIAEQFNVSRRSIGNIINRKTWKHI